MAPKREASSLLLLSLNSVESFVHEIILTVSPEIVRHHNKSTKIDSQKRLEIRNFYENKENDRIMEINDDGGNVEKSDSKEDHFKFDNNLMTNENYEKRNEENNDVNYRKEAVNDYVERLREHIFSHIPYNLIEEAKNRVRKYQTCLEFAYYVLLFFFEIK